MRVTVGAMRHGNLRQASVYICEPLQATRFLRQLTLSLQCFGLIPMVSPMIRRDVLLALVAISLASASRTEQITPKSHSGSFTVRNLRYIVF